MSVAYHAAIDPGRMAILSPAGRRTFGELNARVNQMARALRAAGVTPGDGIALLVGNRPEFVETHQAALRIGARVTPINWHLGPDEVAYIVDDSEAIAFVADAAFAPAADFAARRAARLWLRLAVGGEINGFAATMCVPSACRTRSGARASSRWSSCSPASCRRQSWSVSFWLSAASISLPSSVPGPSTSGGISHASPPARSCAEWSGRPTGRVGPRRSSDQGTRGSVRYGAIPVRIRSRPSRLRGDPGRGRGLRRPVRSAVRGGKARLDGAGGSGEGAGNRLCTCPGQKFHLRVAPDLIWSGLGSDATPNAGVPRWRAAGRP